MIYVSVGVTQQCRLRDKQMGAFILSRGLNKRHPVTGYLYAPLNHEAMIPLKRLLSAGIRQTETIFSLKLVVIVNIEGPFVEKPFIP